ncbi:hypothetical protein IG631_24088 [Alternaria alternata]|nr:hypothetical protein IG631_24088 [Alternaria alternata]
MTSVTVCVYYRMLGRVHSRPCVIESTTWKLLERSAPCSPHLLLVEVSVHVGYMIVDWVLVLEADRVAVRKSCE